MNINTITSADYLGRNDVARQAVVTRAEAATKNPAFQRAVQGRQDSAAVRYYSARKELDSLELPIEDLPAATGGVQPLLQPAH